ncbi:MAG: hypothetical protein MUO51_05300 [Woeseiaceae bacterium]|nr:hypothetical protein [Woeseiaceae bacterium]
MSTVTAQPKSMQLTSDRFYQNIAVLCAAVAFAGFLPSYWSPMWQAHLHIPRVVHLHGAIFFAWTLFFVAQTSLVAHGRTAMHRELGLLGIALATAMLFTGTMVSIGSMHRFFALGFVDEARAFAIVPLSAIMYFAAVVTYAIVNIKRPEIHKRAMVLATVALLQPAIARWFIFFLAPPDATGPVPVILSVAPGLVSDLLLVYAMIHDKRTRGRPHSVYVIGAIVLLTVQVARVPLSTSAFWFSIADWFSALSG